MPNISKIKLDGVSYNIKDTAAVSVEAQTLTDEQKAQAQANIGLPGASTAIENLQTQVGVLAYQNEWVGSIATVIDGEEQTTLSGFVGNTAGRPPRKGDEVTIADRQEIWYFNGENWVVFMSSTELTDATSTTKGLVQIGNGLNVADGVVSVSNPLPTGGTSGQILQSQGPNVAPQWVDMPSGGGVDIVVSKTQPTNQKAGDLWFQILD